MAILNYNIKQKTNYSCVRDEVGTILKTFALDDPNQENITTITAKYYELNKGYLLNQEENLSKANILKLGFICEPRWIGCPIFLKHENETEYNTCIYIGKTGMFEINPGFYFDINDSQSEEQDFQPKITGILVPKCKMIEIREGVYEENLPPIKFKLDYIYNIN